MNAVVDTTNRLSAAGYDAAGNQTTWGTYSYTWDLMGMMKAYQGSGNDWAYAYDADDERMFVYNVVTGQSTFRIRGLDGKVLREVKLTGSTWSWGKDWIYRDGQLLATTASGSVTRYAHADHLGSPRLFTDTAGVAKDKFHYYPFGEQAGTAPTAPEALRFTGHERDSGASSGTADDLDYMHARYYHPQLGRFLSTDTAPGVKKIPISWNRFAYAWDSPLSFNDPDGLLSNPVTRKTGFGRQRLVERGGQRGQVRQNAAGRVNGAFGAPRANGRSHKGVDLVAPAGAPLYAIAAGKVVYAGPTAGAGGVIVKIDHGRGLTSTQVHLSGVMVKTGDIVAEGQVVGSAGRTGNVASSQPASEDHVHLNIQLNGESIDPEAFLNSPERQLQFAPIFETEEPGSLEEFFQDDQVFTQT